MQTAPRVTSQSLPEEKRGLCGIGESLRLQHKRQKAYPETDQ
jgi:hypothetical protein